MLMVSIHVDNIYNYVGMYVCMYVCMYVYMYVCMHVRMYVYVCTCMYVYIIIEMYMYIIYACIFRFQVIQSKQDGRHKGHNRDRYESSSLLNTNIRS